MESSHPARFNARRKASGPLIREVEGPEPWLAESEKNAKTGSPSSTTEVSPGIQDIRHRLRELSVQDRMGATRPRRMQIQVSISLGDELNRIASHSQFNA
jgi:hypothetical protein